jgi:hypothetical protein
MHRSLIVTRIGVGLSALALAGLSTTLAEANAKPSAKAITSCTNMGCSGKWAGPTGCTGDSRTITSAAITDKWGNTLGWVSLRWSPTCGNNWTQVTSSERALSEGGTLVAVATRADGAKRWNSGKGEFVSTSMIFGRDLCVTASGSINGVWAKTACK